jgi:hypothetical protein
MKKNIELLYKVINLGSIETLSNREIVELERMADSDNSDIIGGIKQIDFRFKTSIGHIELYGYEEKGNEESIYHIEKDSEVRYFDTDGNQMSKYEFVNILRDIEDELASLTDDYNGNYYQECEQSFLERNNDWLDESKFEESRYNDIDAWKEDELRKQLRDDYDRYINFLIDYADGIEIDIIDNMEDKEANDVRFKLKDLRNKLHQFKKTA